MLKYLKQIVAVLIFMIPCFVHSAESTDYIKAIDVSPIRSSYDELYKIITTIRKLAEDANKATGKETKIQESITISDNDNNSVKLKTGFVFDDFKDAPHKATKIDYELNLYQAPISSVTISLNDSYRTINVTGLSRVQVEAVAYSLKEKFDFVTVNFTGFDFRTIGGAFLMLTALVFAVFGIYSLAHAVSPKGILFVVIGVLIYSSLFILPWKSWFPGTILYNNNLSFWDRHAGFMSVVGTGIAICSSVFYFFRDLLKKKTP